MNTCQKVVKVQSPYGGIESKHICGKLAQNEINGVNLCNKHARKGRFVIRDGDVGPILARFDTEEQVRKAIVDFPGMEMQKIKNGYRRTIFPKNEQLKQ